MRINKGNSLAETKRLNRIGIKNRIFRNENITRAEISKSLALTLPTITTNIHEMILEGMLEEVPFEGKNSGMVGRKPTFIRFRKDYACAVGVELGPYSTRVVIVDAIGNLVRHKTFHKAENDYQKMIERLSKWIKEMLPENQKILGVGVGLPGFIEPDSGIIRTNFREDWTGRHLAADLEERLNLPVYIDNNVRLMALGYDLAMKNSAYDTFAYFYMSKGIACPLVIKNELLSGFTAGSGEIGENTVSLIHEGKKRKVLDDLGSEKAIFEACATTLREKEFNLNGKEIEVLTSMEEVLKLQEEGVMEINEIVNRAIEYMGLALSHVVNLINPGLVVIDSQIFMREENKKAFKKSARKYFYSLNEDEVKMVFVPYEETRGARGAAYYIIKKLLLEN